MKTEYITCDECGFKINTRIENIPEKIKGIYDICSNCKDKLLEEYFGRNEPKFFKTINCKKCNGSGKIKNFYGYNNDFEWITCECTKGI